MKKVVLYGREGCCLCDQAREVLHQVRARQVFQLEELDIDADERLFKAYLERIPVVTIDGVEAFELFVEEGVFEQLLADGAGRPLS